MARAKTLFQPFAELLRLPGRTRNAFACLPSWPLYSVCSAVAATVSAQMAIWERNVADEQRNTARDRLAESYWQSAVRARDEGRRLEAVHLLALSAANEPKPTRRKRAILGIHDYLRSTFLDSTTEGYEQARLTEGTSLPLEPDAILSPDEERIFVPMVAWRCDPQGEWPSARVERARQLSGEFAF